MPEIPFQEATLEDLLLLIGGLINRGGQLEDIDMDLIMRLQELIDYEIEFRLTGIPRGTQIH
jgi:2-phospho-L-lactate transferase/gluconeogenesis factor (CofD/UPF0052 family)